MPNKDDREEGLSFLPRFDEHGLIPCITVDARTNTVLMMAYMNVEALAKTVETGEAHYWSRSRKALWHKGASSGFRQKIVEILTDCDQDCLLLKVNVAAHESREEGTCHTGRSSCFYRALQLRGSEKPVLKFI